MASSGGRQSIENVQDRLVQLVPLLRVLALMLTGDKKRADELARATLVQALTAAESAAGRAAPARMDEQEFKVWLVRQLRQTFSRNPISMTPKLDNLPEAGDVAPAGSPFDHAHFRRAFWQLRPDQREVLILTGAGGFTAEQVAAIRECRVATARSQATRARNLLKKILEREAKSERRRDPQGSAADPAHR